MKRFLKNAIREGVSRGIGDAIEKAVEPKAAELTGKAMEFIDRKTGGTMQSARQHTADLEDALSGLEKTMGSYADKISRSTKLCPKCGQPASAEKSFCPNCGGKLPDETIAQGTLCPVCGKQNDLRSRFCEDCGTKLPAAVREEQMQARRDDEELAQWDSLLPQFPKWSCGGREYNLEDLGHAIVFSAGFGGDTTAAHNAVLEYRRLLRAEGFRPAGEYPSEGQLYKMVGDVCWHADTENCFDGDGDRPCIGFDASQPRGGFHYEKPQPKMPPNLKNLFRR